MQRINKLTQRNELEVIDAHSPFAILHQLSARKRSLFFATIIATILGLILTQSKPTIFVANSVLQFEQRPKTLALPSELLEEMILGGESGTSSLEAEFHVIRSRLTLEPVIKDQNLQVTIEPLRAPFFGNLLQRATDIFEGRAVFAPILHLYPEKYPRNGEEILVDEIFVSNPTEVYQYKIRIIDEEQYELQDHLGEVLAVGKFDHKLTYSDQLILVLSRNNVPGGRTFDLTYKPVRDVTASLSTRLKISERGGRNGTGIVDFSFTDNDPTQAVNILNQIIAQYRAQTLDRDAREIDQSIFFIQEKLPDIESEVAAASDRLNAYLEGNAAISSLSISAEQNLNRTISLEADLHDIEFQIAQLALNVTENHPDFKRLLAEKDAAEARLSEVRTEISSLPKAEQELARLRRDLETSIEVQSQLKARIEQLKILKASAVGTIRVLESAETAEYFGPDRTRPVIIFALLGLSIASIWVLLSNKASNSIESKTDLDGLGLSVFATIPSVKLKGLGADELSRIAKLEPSELVVESIRGLRTGLQFSENTRNHKLLAITSSVPNEGKSFVCSNLAIVSADSGLKTLLIDADMRRGAHNRLFSIKRNLPGLSEFLASKANLKDVIYSSSEFGFDLLPTGTFPPNPSELLASERFSSLCDEVRQDYDLVIIDCPPVLAVTDPLIVSARVKNTFLVVRQHGANKFEVAAAISEMESKQINLSGAIFNGFDSERSRYGRYGGQYAYGYGGYQYSYKENSK